MLKYVINATLKVFITLNTHISINLKNSCFGSIKLFTLYLFNKNIELCKYNS